MHSKVIVASLVCMLAASFGAGNKITSGIKQTNYKLKNNVCLAPNDDGGSISIINPMVSVDDECRAIFTCGDTINSVRVIKSTKGVSVSSAIVGDDARLFISTTNKTRPNQAVVVGFIVGRKSLQRTIKKTIYIHFENGTCCYSALSYSDAKTMYFMNYVATAEQLAELANGSPVFEGESSGFDFPDNPYDPDPGHPDPWPPFPPIPDPNPPRMSKNSLRAVHFDPGESYFPTINDPLTPTAEQTYVDYIFGDTQDMTFTVDLVSKEGLQPWQQRAGTGLNAQVNWYDENNNMRPAEGVSVQFYANGAVLHDMEHIFSQEPMSYDYRTGATGYCNVDVRSDAKLNVLEARICADSLSTRVEDRFNIDYPFFARASSSLFALDISDYAEITFTINIYQKKSERGQAFAMSQMQNVPFDYADEFTPTGVTAVETEFPAAKTFYDGENDKIFVQEEDYKSWDVLTHEYGHHIADSLNLCYIPDERMEHNVYQDLTIAYGDSVGKQLAYAEGLATYLGLASQMYYASEYSDTNYGDEIYKDQYRDVNADYNNYHLGGNNIANPDAVEARITSVLIKLLDNVERDYDDVSLGHQAMWNALIASKNSDSVNELIKKITDQNQDVIDDIVKVLDEEGFYDILEVVAPDEWTIMIYMCGSTLVQEACEDLEEILSINNQPYDVNIIIETGGTNKDDGYYWRSWNTGYPNGASIPYGKTSRYYVKNRRLVQIEDFSEKTSMGNSSTFEEFLKWGIEEFPAKKMGVIMWDHGAALRGVCSDYTFNKRFPDRLKNSEALAAFQNVFDAGLSDKFEFIGYDACLMQVQDIAEVNSHYFNYMIASEELEEGAGWEYDQWIDKVYAKEDTETILKAIANSYIDEFEADNTSSILDLNQMSTYYDLFESFALSIKETALNNFDTFSNVIRSTKRFNSGSDFENTCTIDGYDFLCKLQENPTFATFSSQIELVKQAYDNVVLYNRIGETAGEAHGLAIVIQLTVRMGYDPNETNFNNWQSIFEDHEFSSEYPSPL